MDWGIGSCDPGSGLGLRAIGGGGGGRSSTLQETPKPHKRKAKDWECRRRVDELKKAEEA